MSRGFPALNRVAEGSAESLVKFWVLRGIVDMDALKYQRGLFLKYCHCPDDKLLVTGLKSRSMI